MGSSPTRPTAACLVSGHVSGRDPRDTGPRTTLMLKAGDTLAQAVAFKRRIDDQLALGSYRPASTMTFALDGDHRQDLASGMEQGERPVNTGTWTDEAGVLWTRRGVTTSVKRARLLLGDEDTRVLRTVGPHLEDVEGPAARSRYWQHVAPYLEGKVHRVPGERTSDHFDCQVGEFRDADRRRLLIFQEDC